MAIIRICGHCGTERRYTVHCCVKCYAELVDKAALANELVAALEALVVLVRAPNNEYSLTRTDGEACGLADQMIIGSKYEKAEAALAKWEKRR